MDKKPIISKIFEEYSNEPIISNKYLKLEDWKENKIGKKKN